MFILRVANLTYLIHVHISVSMITLNKYRENKVYTTPVASYRLSWYIIRWKQLKISSIDTF